MKEIMSEQNKLGIDIPTDGELYRENYIYFQCRHMNGFDFEHLQKLSMRNGQYIAHVPRIISPVSAINNNVLVSQWMTANKFNNDLVLHMHSDDNKSNNTGNININSGASSNSLVGHVYSRKLSMRSSKTKIQRCNNNNKDSVKITLAGPMTIADTTFNAYYDNENKLLWDLACAVNVEVLKLIKNGAKYIQIDEPLFARKPEKARDIGFKCLERCLLGVNNLKRSSSSSSETPAVTTFVHICCGYSDELDDTTYKKADNHGYMKLARYGLDELDCVDYFSIEDAHSRVPLEFFKLMKNSGIQLGCVKVCSKDIYTQNEIVSRVSQIIDKTGFDANKLMLSPDCGLAMLPRDIVFKKMITLRKARDTLRQVYNYNKQESYPLVAKL